MKIKALLLVVAAALAGCATTAVRDSALARIDTIVVIYAENHSFDNMYGMFPGANGVAHATTEERTQLDHDGTVLANLPPVYTQGKPDLAYPDSLPNGPFRIDLPPIGARL